jgi:glycosyltransferase involved in cell wall biosynthesis
MPKISALINTLNEEDNIEQCLQALKFVDEIVVIDQKSDDKTLEIAKKYTNKIYSQERIGYASREYGFTKLSNEWVLIVDADEIIPINLMKELINIAESNSADVVIIPRINYFFGFRMNHGHMNCLKDKQIRFGKKEYIIPNDIAHIDFTIHENARIKNINNTSLAMYHFSHFDFETYIAKINKYSTFEALNIIDGRKPELKFIKRLYVIMGKFFKYYIYNKGYKDGYIAFAVFLLDAFYQIIIHIKFTHIKKMKSKNIKSAVRDIYDEKKSFIINEYNNK